MSRVYATDIHAAEVFGRDESH